MVNAADSHRQTKRSIPSNLTGVDCDFLYIIVHEIDADADQVIVLGVFHGAQKRSQ